MVAFRIFFSFENNTELFLNWSCGWNITATGLWVSKLSCIIDHVSKETKDLLPNIL